jgi:hypothetical protein
LKNVMSIHLELVGGDAPELRHTASRHLRPQTVVAVDGRSSHGRNLSLDHETRGQAVVPFTWGAPLRWV